MQCNRKSWNLFGKMKFHSYSLVYPIVFQNILKNIHLKMLPGGPGGPGLVGPGGPILNE
jgi:hypothetical protein